MGRLAEALLREDASAGGLRGFKSLVERSAGDAVATPWPGVRYGYGLKHVRRGQLRAVGHLGNASHSSALWVLPQEQLGLVLLVGGYSPARARSIAEGTLQVLRGQDPPALAGPSDLTALVWVSRSMVVMTALSAALLLSLLVAIARRLRRGAPRLTQAMVWRAGFLSLLAPVLLWFGLDGVRQIWSDLPAPTGFGTAPLQGYPTEVALALAGAALTATGWALYALVSVLSAWTARRGRRRGGAPMV